MKLSNQDVSAMKRMSANGIPTKEIAGYFNVDQSTVGYHINGVTKERKQGRYLKQRLQSIPDGNVVDFIWNYLR